ncbi:MAG: BrnT family toxin [Thermoanaerobaculia bacterium]
MGRREGEGEPQQARSDDPDHSNQEQRELIIGHSTTRRLLIISFTERADRIRIISARAATNRERRDHEQNTKEQRQR